MKHQIDPNEHGPLGQQMADAVSTCVHCGFCLSACPTYKLLGQETDSPRGRIVLMKEVLEGTLTTKDVAKHIDPCLGCLACEPACPSGVPYRDLISPYRAISAQNRKGNWFQRLKRLLVTQTLPYPNRFYLGATLGRILKPLASSLPTTPRAMLDLLPDELPGRSAWKEVYPAEGTRRARVALLLGCAQRVLDPDINTATISVLKRNGVEVLVPEKQNCCGALSWHVGNLRQAQAFAVQNLHAFPDDVDAIVTNAAGCGSGMHEYGMILKGTEHEEKAIAFSNRVMDVSKFLVGLGDLQPVQQSTTAEAAIRIAYQDACHLGNAQGVIAPPRQLLRMIPSVELLEMKDQHQCCGSAGTYNIDQPSLAAKLGREKAQNIIDTGADIVASGNIGCMMQLKQHLEKLSSEIQVRHTMQVLRDAYRGTQG